MTKTHSFHIPVMGLGFTIDTPLKVAQYGIDSVISLGDDILLEKLRKLFCTTYDLPYDYISEKDADCRARRITSYLNLMNKLVSDQFEKFKKLAPKNEVLMRKYLNMLPDGSALHHEFKNFLEKLPSPKELSKWIDKHLAVGSIDVNIMTKVDKETYAENQRLPQEYNQAHSALRGYAESDLASSIIFSAGLNPRLYSYIEQFEDFYPTKNGELKKKIVLKVSDYRSALIQGKFLAKKGLWVSEYRIESGLNCGGHAFATDGFLLGPILAEFKDKREEITQTVQEIYLDALSRKSRTLPEVDMSIKISAQGGVGTYDEHQFLLDHFDIDSVGWGSPFLLVPEATVVDDTTLNKLLEAREDDLYLSHTSPLGVPFNNLRKSTKEKEKKDLIAKGKPGSPCFKKFLAFDREFSDKGLCSASRKYQNLKLKELSKENLTPQEYQKRFDEIVDKECLCTGLGSSALIVHNLDTTIEGDAVSICPGPNIAYFSRIMSLQDITNHIYGRNNMITRSDRPNMFVKELKIYLDYLKDKVQSFHHSPSSKQGKHLVTFVQNLNSGIEYYKDLFSNLKHDENGQSHTILKDLKKCQGILDALHKKLECTLTMATSTS